MNDGGGGQDCPDGRQMLDRIMASDLRYLMAVSYVVLANNQITNRFIERRHDMPVQAWSALYAIAQFPGLRARDIQVLFPAPRTPSAARSRCWSGGAMCARIRCPTTLGRRGFTRRRRVWRCWTGSSNLSRRGRRN
ncbi:hypothetical protein ACFSYD_21865 [Paracoccus aerius]